MSPVDTAKNVVDEIGDQETESDATELSVTDCLAESEGAGEKVSEDAVDAETNATTGRQRRSVVWIFGFWVLPVVALLVAGSAGYLKYEDSSARGAEVARIESVQAAKDAAVAMLSYAPDNVDTTLDAARDRLTGAFRDSYTSLVHDVVIPGAKQKQITATATVPAAASTNADESHAVVLVFVNQAIVVGNDAPTDTASAVEVTLDKVDGHWLVSGFDPR